MRFAHFMRRAKNASALCSTAWSARKTPKQEADEQRSEHRNDHQPDQHGDQQIDPRDFP